MLAGLAAAVKRIEKDGVIVEREGREQILEPVDQVVIAVGLRSREELKKTLRSSGCLTRGPRMKERKKYGQPGARKRFQFSKR